MRLFAAAALFLLSGCSLTGEGPAEAPKVAPILDSKDAEDVYSFAKPLEARVSHVSLDLDLDFDKKAVAGTAVLDVIVKPGIDTIILDTDGLEIASVTDAEGNADFLGVRLKRVR